MDREQVMEKIKIMVREDQERIIERCGLLIKSGAVDVGAYGDDFRLPKIVLYATLLDLADSRRPLFPEDRREADNLRCF